MNTSAVESKKESRNKLQEKLRAKIKDKSMCRVGKENSKKMLDRAFAQLGIDKEKLMADIQAVKKQGTLNTTMERLQSLAKK